MSENNSGGEHAAPAAPVEPMVTRNQAGYVVVLMTPATAQMFAEAANHYDLLTQLPAAEVTDQMFVDPAWPDWPAFPAAGTWDSELAQRFRIELLRQVAGADRCSPGEVVAVPRHNIPARADVKREQV